MVSLVLRLQRLLLESLLLALLFGQLLRCSGEEPLVELFGVRQVLRFLILLLPELGVKRCLDQLLLALDLLLGLLDLFLMQLVLISRQFSPHVVGNLRWYRLEIIVARPGATHFHECLLSQHLAW